MADKAKLKAAAVRIGTAVGRAERTARRVGKSSTGSQGRTRAANEAGRSAGA